MEKSWRCAFVELILKFFRNFRYQISDAKFHLNAPISSARVASAGVLAEAEPCAFCGAAESDSLAHVTCCPCVTAAYDQLRNAAGLPPLRGWELMLQRSMDGGTRAVVVSFFAAVWKTRAAARIGADRITAEELAALIETAINCPWLDFCIAGTMRKERRARRARAVLRRSAIHG